MPASALRSLAERKAWHRKLYEAGYVGMCWPKEYGGQGARPMEQAIVADEMARVGRAAGHQRPRASASSGPTIIVHGTEAQKQRYLKKILTAEEIWCQLYSEPNAGSDLAGAARRAPRTTATTSSSTARRSGPRSGHIADWGMLLARTDPEVAKHKGISCFLLNMRQPGVEVRPLKQITGCSEFCEVFMTNARVEKADLIGKLGEGWAIAQTTLGYERGGNSLGARHRATPSPVQPARRGGATAQAPRPAAHRGPASCGRSSARSRPSSRSQRYAALRVLSALERASIPAPASSLTKLSYTEFEKRFRRWRWRSWARTASSRRRAAGAGVEIDTASGDQGTWAYAFLWSRAGTIYCGLLGDPEEHHRRARARPAQGSRAPTARRADADGLRVHATTRPCSRTPPGRSSTSTASPSTCAPMWEDARGYERGAVEARWPSSAGWACPSRGSTAAAGLGLVELALLLEELGRAAYPGPFLATVVLGGLPLLARRLRRPRRRSGCPPSPRGDARVTAALLEERLDWNPASDRRHRRARRRGLDALRRQALRAVGPRGGRGAGARPHARRRVAVPRGPDSRPGVTLTPDAPAWTSATRWSELTLDGVAGRAPTTLVGARRAARARCWTRLLRRAAVGASAEMLGAARRCLDMAVGYAKVREQFGQPIGSFQAIRHKCAEMLLEVENAHSAVYYAAWALDAGAEDAAMAASICKSYVSDAARKVCGEAIQVHGGIGFTWEYDLHLYFKRAKALEAQYGDADYHRELIAQARRPVRTGQ